MNRPRPADVRALEEKAFWLLVIAVSVAFTWIMLPFFGAVLWGTILAILFAPVYRRMARMLAGRRNVAALTTVMVIVMMVILPVTLLAVLLLQEGLGIYARIQSGDVRPGQYLQQIFDALPAWVTQLLERFGLPTLADVQERVSTSFVRGIQLVAPKVLDIGQNTFDFVLQAFIMLYLLFFLLRDGDVLWRRIRDALPLREEVQRGLAGKFTTVIRATVKGGIVVAALQGALGGLIFWFLGIHAPILWGVLMAFLSLLPAVGAGLVWLPVAIYLLVTGATWQGVLLIAYGILVIGLVDNVLRPVLVGKDTRMPDYVVLVATIGGIAIFGINGFVIGPVIAAMFIAVWAMVAAMFSSRSTD
jgi:predicted PurR-regulated permease PerM